MRVSDPIGRSLEGGPLRFRVLSTTDQALDVANPIIVDRRSGRLGLAASAART